MRRKTDSLIGRAIGRLAANLSGLNATYLAPEAAPAVGAAIVREANLLRPMKPPFAILVSRDKSASERNLPVVTRAESIRYRQGDRLAVVPATSVDLASFDGAFREVLGSGFPEAALPPFDVASIALELIQLIAEGADVDSRDIPMDAMGEVLSTCLRATADIVMAEQEGSAGWNAKWFLAVDHGAESLIAAVREGSADGTVATFEEAIDKFVWPCFGLPRPKNGRTWQKKHKATAFVQSLQDVWSAKDTVDQYTREVVLSQGVDADALEACSQEGWDGLDEHVVGLGSGLLGLQSFVTQEGGRLRAFSDISEESFIGSGTRAGEMRLMSASGASLGLSSTQSTIALVSSIVGTDGRWVTEQVTIVAPLNTAPPSSVTAATETRVQASGTARIVSPSRPRLIDRAIHFEFSLSVPPTKSFALKKVGLSIEVAPDDSLLGYLASDAISIYVAPPTSEGVVTAQWNSGKKSALRQPRFEGASADDDAETVFGAELKPDVHYRVAVWSKVSPPVTSAMDLYPWEGRDGWFLGDLLPNTGASLAIEGSEWNLTPGGASEAPQSLLVAAIDNTRVDPEDPDFDTVDSLRGQLESLLAARAADDDFLGCLGHIALPSELPAGDMTAIVAHRGFQMPSAAVPFWDQRVALDAGIRSGSRADLARSAFLSTWRECIESTTVPDAGGVTSRWPSKRSVRHLAVDGTIDRLLDAYAELLEACADESAATRFLSAFPFSTSIWGKVADDVECTGVLLSPWHPIRLAWLARVEDVLWQSERARDLAGIVEGWRFPMMGPGPEDVDRMIAVPIDTGKDQVFVGWSMVVRLATGKARHLGPPSQAASMRMPGSAPSGLTGTAADAAMRDFIRANPHLPSVTVDLASSARGPRLAEIDASVIRAVGEWSKRTQPILGVRVLDQLTREGDLPRDLLGGLFRDNLKTSISWSRYAGDGVDAAARPRSNLRLLQDSGVRVGHIEKPSGRESGVLAGAAIRRYETVGSTDDSSSTSMEPGLPTTDDSFTRAIRAIEGSESPPHIRLTTAVSALLNDSSDWTISGESFLSPSALAHMIANQNGATTDRMLWEWRPPFLRPSREQSPLGRRPYVTIARVAGSLVEQVTAQVGGIVESWDSDDVPALVDDIFRTLGTRGIGLSSLLSMGGQHASGALGFYLALKLMGDMPLSSDVVQVVLPLDSCQTFLDALAPDSGVAETRRRADLLAIRVTDGQVVLSPIEIKFYGSAGDGGQLPSPGHEFLEPRDQLEATMDLLRKMQSERARLRGDSHAHDAMMWDAAMATLFEAGLRLSPNQPHDQNIVRQALDSLAHGKLRIGLGRPLILFFRHQVGATETAVSYTEGSLDPKDVMSAYGALAVRPQPALREFSRTAETSGDVLTQWASLVEWSMANPVLEAQHSQLPQAVSVPEEAEQESYPSSFDAQEDDLGSRFDTGPAPVPVPVPDVIRESDTADLSGRSEASHEVDGDAGLCAKESTEGRQEVVVEESTSPHMSYGTRFVVGDFQAALAGARAEYWPGNSETTQLNMGIVGDLGTGKTQLLKALILNLRRGSKDTQERPVDCLVFDYKRDFQDSKFVESVGATVWQPSRMPLNVLDLYEPYSRAAAYRRAAAFTTMLERIYKGVGPVQRDRLIGVIMDLYESRSGEAPTLGEVLEVYREESSGDSVTSILNTFVLGEIFSENRAGIVSLDEAMRDTVLVVDLNSLGADSYTKNAIVVFFLDMFYERMKRMEKVPPWRAKDGVTVRNISSYLLVDEASNIMKYKFDVLDTLLKEGREFGVGTILSSQYLSHFRVSGANYAEALSTWFIHKVPNATHTELSSLGIKDATFEMAERIRGLKVHESLYRSDLSPTRFIREVPFWRQVEDA